MPSRINRPHSAFWIAHNPNPTRRCTYVHSTYVVSTIERPSISVIVGTLQVGGPRELQNSAQLGIPALGVQQFPAELRAVAFEPRRQSAQGDHPVAGYLAG